MNDSERRLPAKHPVSLQLFNPQNISFVINSDFKNFNIENFNFRLQSSHLMAEKLIVDLPKDKSISSILDSTYLDIEIDGENISAKELSSFSPKLKKLNESLDLDLSVKGYLSDLHININNISSKNNLKIKGNAQITGLKDGFDSYVYGRLNECYIPSEVSQHISQLFLEDKLDQI